MAAYCLPSCSPAPNPPLRVGINIWPGYELISLAQSLGHFRAEGLTVDIVEFDSLSHARRALESGKVDAIGTTMIELVMINFSPDTRSARVIRAFDYSDGADMIIAPKEIRSIAELKDKPVGVEVASLGVFPLGRALEISGLQFADVKPVSTHQLAMKDMLQSGRIAAAVTFRRRPSSCSGAARTMSFSTRARFRAKSSTSWPWTPRPRAILPPTWPRSTGPCTTPGSI